MLNYLREVEESKGRCDIAPFKDFVSTKVSNLEGAELSETFAELNGILSAEFLKKNGLRVKRNSRDLNRVFEFFTRLSYYDLTKRVDVVRFLFTKINALVSFHRAGENNT